MRIDKFFLQLFIFTSAWQYLQSNDEKLNAESFPTDMWQVLHDLSSEIYSNNSKCIFETYIGRPQNARA